MTATVTIRDHIAHGPTAAADWTVIDPSCNPPDSQMVYLGLYPADREAWIDTTPRCMAFYPDAVARDLELRWFLPDGTDAEAAWAVITGPEVAADLAAVCDGWTERRNAQDRDPVGVLDAAAADAAERLDRRLRNVPQMERGGIIEAGDWLRDADLDIAADTTDGDLDAMADEIDAEARGEGFVVVGTRTFLHDRRADVRREAVR